MDRCRTRVLLIEDDAADELLVRRRLSSPLLWGSYCLERCDRLETGLERLRRGDYDVLLLDLHLPDSQGLETLRRARAVDSKVPTVVFTTAGDEVTALGALDAGAQDYLVKDENIGGPQIERAISYAIERRRLTDENAELHTRLLERERSESLHWLAGGVTTAFENLLAEVRDRVEGALAGPARGFPALRRDLGWIYRQTLRASRTARQLQTYAEQDPVGVARVELSGLLQQMSELLESMLPSGVELDLELDSALPPIRVDVLQCRQLLMDLALYATECVGHQRPASVTLRTGTFLADREALDACPGGSALDAGAFVFASVSAREIADRANVGAVGSSAEGGRSPADSGLDAAREIARRHGGVLREERDPDPAGGVRLTVLLPTARIPARRQGEPVQAFPAMVR